MKKLIILLLLVLVSSALAFEYGLISKTSGSMSDGGSVSIDSRKFTGRVVHYDLQFTEGTLATTGVLTSKKFRTFYTYEGNHYTSDTTLATVSGIIYDNLQPKEAI